MPRATLVHRLVSSRPGQVELGGATVIAPDEGHENRTPARSPVGMRPAVDTLAVDVITNPAALETFGPEWDALVAQAGIAHPFLAHDWVRTWWACFGGDRQLHVVVVRDAGVPIAIAPLMRSRIRMYGVEVPALEFLLNDHTPRFDLILTTRPHEAVAAIWKHLSDTGEWRVLQLRQLPVDSPALADLSSLAVRDGCDVSMRDGDQSPFVPFSGAWSDYIAARSRNHRSKIRKGLNRLSGIADLQLEVIADPADIDSALEDGLRIEAAAWKEDSGTAIRSHGDVSEFYRQFAACATRAGALRLIFLKTGRRRIAFAYAIESGRKLFVLKAGYDPEYARFSPYNLLCYLVFQDGFARRLVEYEFLGANEPWKLDWTTAVHAHQWLFVFRRGLLPHALYLAKCRLAPRLHERRKSLVALFARG